MKSIINELVSRLPQLEACRESIEMAVTGLIHCFESKGKLLLCGNGGSAADCEHIAGELVKGFLKKRPLSESAKRVMTQRNPALDDGILNDLQGGLPAISLTGAPSLSTAFANDVNPVLTFAQQLSVLGAPNDILLGISTSGNAANVVAAANVAKGLGMKVIALSGGTGGALSRAADISVIAPESETFRVQELHLPIYHAICAAVETHFYKD